MRECVLQLVAVCCSVYECSAAMWVCIGLYCYCNSVQLRRSDWRVCVCEHCVSECSNAFSVWQCEVVLHKSAKHCKTLQTAKHCKTLHNTAKHCKTLRNTATHCKTLRHSWCSVLSYFAVVCDSNL